MKDPKETTHPLKAYKLYAGKDGHSYFLEGFIDERKLVPVNQIHFKTTAPYSNFDWHTAPCTQYVITLRGTLKFTTSLEKTFILKPGEILIATDTAGKGHKWEIIGDEPWTRCYVIFDHLEQLNFVADPL